MTTWFKLGYKTCFLSYDDAEVLGRHRWKNQWSPDKIERFDIDAEPLYTGHDSASGFSVWSDGKIRPLVLSRLVPPNERYDFPSDRPVQEKSDAIDHSAIKLMIEVLGSDSGQPEWLGQVRHVERSTSHQEGSKPGHYAGVQVERLVMSLADGSKITKYLLTEGYFEGYMAEFFGSVAEAIRWRDRLGWYETECLECGAKYDAPGYVEPEAMGCDRCDVGVDSDWRKHLVE